MGIDIEALATRLQDRGCGRLRRLVEGPLGCHCLQDRCGQQGVIRDGTYITAVAPILISGTNVLAHQRRPQSWARLQSVDYAYLAAAQHAAMPIGRATWLSAQLAFLLLPTRVYTLRYTSYVYRGCLMTKIRRRARAERTNIVLDSKLVQRVKRIANVKTTRDAVHIALEHYVRSRDYSGVLALRGTGGVAADYDPKAPSPTR